MKVRSVGRKVTNGPIFLKSLITTCRLRESVSKVPSDLVEKLIVMTVGSTLWPTPTATPLKSSGKPLDYVVIAIGSCLKRRICITAEPEDTLTKLTG